jgi:Exo-beta-D-glucosaminidase Ig-fold domain
MSSGEALWQGLLLIALLLGLSLPASSASVPLHTGWKLQSGCVAKSSGDCISLSDYRTNGWIDAIVPGTVLGSQVAGTDEEITPIFWSDNFVSLMPGDSRTLTVTGLPDAKQEVEIKLDGWNVEARTLRVAAMQ